MRKVFAIVGLVVSMSAFAAPAFAADLDDPYGEPPRPAPGLYEREVYEPAFPPPVVYAPPPMVRHFPRPYVDVDAVPYARPYPRPLPPPPGYRPRHAEIEDYGSYGDRRGPPAPPYYGRYRDDAY